MFVPLIVIVLIIVLASGGQCGESNNLQEYYTDLDYFDAINPKHTKPEGFEQTAHDKFMSDCYQGERY